MDLPTDRSHTGTMAQALRPGGLQAVFEQLFKDNFRGVMRFFLRRGFSYEDSLDLTQETFLRVYKGMGRFRGEANPRNWLFQIATNVWCNELRRRSAHKRDGQEVPIEPAEASPDTEDYGLHQAPGIVEALVAEERLSLVAQAIEELPPRMRQCLLLCTVQELTYGETAQVMRTSVETVRTQVYEARRRLRAGLDAPASARAAEASAGVDTTHPSTVDPS